MATTARAIYLSAALILAGGSWVRSANAAAVPRVILRCGPTAYSIPTNYLAGYHAQRGGGDSSAVTFLVTLPSLQPMSKATAATLLAPKSLDKLRAVITCDSRTRLDPTDDQIEFIIHNALMLTDDQYSVVTGGYRLYRIANRFAQELYVGPVADGKRFFFQCMGDGAAPYPSCTIIERWTTQLLVICYFDKRYKSTALPIDMALRNLLASFAMPGQR